VAQGIGPEFKSQYRKEKKKQNGLEVWLTSSKAPVLPRQKEFEGLHLNQ
jgi:hypothetical protein